jgi:hypothetical protein
MKRLILISQKYYLQAALILLLAGLAAITGCSSVDGTTSNQPAIKTRVSTYVQRDQGRAGGTTADSSEDSGYEWFF